MGRLLGLGRPPIESKRMQKAARGVPRATPSSVAAHLEGRGFGIAMAGALHRLAADPSASYRAAARAHGVDTGDLHRAAKTIPGLSELRRGRRGRPRPTPRRAK